MLRVLSLAFFAFLLLPASGRASELSSLTYMYCEQQALLGDDTARETKKKIFAPMTDNAARIGAEIEDFFLSPECVPSYIASTRSPYIHILAENATDRLPYLIEIRRYFLDERKRPDLWRAMVQSKNTIGMTVLDYVEYAIAQKRFIAAEAPGISFFIDFLCANGGGYAISNKRCPKSSEDSAQGILSRLRQ